ncbi:MAG: AraC family transcriptional regulator [Bacteroides sp.]|nr:AraC family transcriptional regulator [Bacteroides sp.]MBQ8224380.1 AraC family transcriptional regulator [Bacteroides sp.]
MGTLELKDEQEFIVRTDDCRLILNRFSKLKEACIFLCRQGEATLEIDSEVYHIKKDTHMVLIPGIIIGNAQVSEDFVATYILFPQTLFHDVTTRLDPSFYRFLKETPAVLLPDDRIRSINRMLAFIEELYLDTENCFRQQILYNHIQSFLLDIYDKTRRLFLARQPEGISRQEELFKRYVQLVHEHCAEQREVSFYADRLCISSRYLSTVVQRVTGTTAKSIIDKHVILEIKAMLKSTNLSVQEISNRLHFPDQSFFGRYFKKHTGLSPLKYRNEL